MSKPFVGRPKSPPKTPQGAERVVIQGCISGIPEATSVLLTACIDREDGAWVRAAAAQRAEFIGTRGGFKATEASLTIAAAQADRCQYRHHLRAAASIIASTAP